MKKLFLILGTIALVSLAVPDLYARWGKPGYDRNGRYGCDGPGYGRGGYGMGRFWRIPELKKELGLNDQQVASITGINKSFSEKYDKERGNREAMWKLHDEHRKAVEKVLTKDQIKKLEENNYYCRRDGRGFRR